VRANEKPTIKIYVGKASHGKHSGDDIFLAGTLASAAIFSQEHKLLQQ
jgi:hypothetical protein